MNTAELELCLLGAPRIRNDGTDLKLSRKKSVALLAYLAANNKPYTRDTLAALLWPQRGDQQARGSLPPEEETERLYQAIKVRKLAALRPGAGRTGTGPPRLAVLPLAGQPEKAEELMKEVVALRKGGQILASDMALNSYFLGNTEEAIDWFERAYEERDLGLLDIKIYLCYEQLKEHARFRELIERIGLPL